MLNLKVAESIRSIFFIKAGDNFVMITFNSTEKLLTETSLNIFYIEQQQKSRFVGKYLPPSPGENTRVYRYIGLYRVE